jgi:hypothetical protein
MLDVAHGNNITWTKNLNLTQDGPRTFGESTENAFLQLHAIKQAAVKQSGSNTVIDVLWDRHPNMACAENMYSARGVLLFGVFWRGGAAV